MNIGGTTGSGIIGLLVFIIPFKSIPWWVSILAVIGLLILCLFAGIYGDKIGYNIKKKLTRKWHGIGKIPGNHYY